MFKKMMFPLLDEIDGAGGGGGSQSIEENTNINDDISFLADEGGEEGEEGEEDEGNESQEDLDRKAVNKDEEELNKEDEDEEENEEGEEEDEEEEEKKKVAKGDKEEDETEDDDPLKAATYSSIKKAYPDFFKKFPGIKSQLFAADAFRRIFPTVEEAKEYKEASEQTVGAFETIKEMVEKGETDNFLSEVKGISDDAYKNFVANFMPALYGNDKDAYYGIATPIVRTAIRNIYDRGLKNGGKKGGTEENFGQNLVNAAIVLHQALFDNGDVETEDKPFVASKKDEDKKDPDREKFESERNDFYTQKYNTLKSAVDSHIITTIKSEIKQGLNQTLPKYILNKLVEDIFTEIDKQVSKDEVHINSTNALWEKEKKIGFTGTNKERIINTVLSRARPLIPVIRKKIASEALKDFRGKINLPKKEAAGKAENKSVSRDSKNRSEKKDLRRTAEISDLDILNMP